MNWRAYGKGNTLGSKGSEGGKILLDEEHKAGARITLEENCHGRIPFAATCGIYGWFFHTRYGDSTAYFELDEMKQAISKIIEMIPLESIATDKSMSQVHNEIEAFLERYPT